MKAQLPCAPNERCDHLKTHTADRRKTTLKTSAEKSIWRKNDECAHNFKRFSLPFTVIVFGVFASFLFLSCSPREPKNHETGSTVPEKLILAEQYGLAYAPVNVARRMGWFEEELPGIRIEWEKAGNAATVREAILAGRMDGGFMGIPPYLIGKDKGMNWTAISAVAEAELGLAAVRPGILTLEDIPPDMRIALPQPGSIQHILLAMAAERNFGDAGRFDNQLITLKHPDGMSALLSGTEVEAHFTSPPYLRKELDSGKAHLILDGEEAFGGEFTFIIAVLTDELIRDYPETVKGIRRALARASEWIGENPEKAAEFLAEQYAMEPGELSDIFHSGILKYGEQIYGMERFRDFMYAEGYLKTHLDDSVLVTP